VGVERQREVRQPGWKVPMRVHFIG